MAKLTMKVLAESLEQIQAQLTELARRVEQLEAGAQQPPAQQEAPVRAAAAPPEPVKPEVTEEELLAISAALAAYLGVRVRIKHIRLVGSHTWAQQGRVWIQASHKLH